MVGSGTSRVEDGPSGLCSFAVFWGVVRLPRASVRGDAGRVRATWTVRSAPVSQGGGDDGYRGGDGLMVMVGDGLKGDKREMVERDGEERNFMVLGGRQESCRFGASLVSLSLGPDEASRRRRRTIKSVGKGPSCAQALVFQFSLTYFLPPDVTEKKVWTPARTLASTAY